MDDHNHFHTVIMVVDAFTAVWGRNKLLFADNYATHPQHTSPLPNVKFVYYAPNCKSMMPCLRTGYG